MNFKDLMYKGEIELLEYFYKNQELELTVECFDDSEVYKISIPTKTVEVNIPEEHLGNPAFATGIFQSFLLKDELLVKNNIFVPPDEFSTFMKNKKKGIHLAYGENFNDKLAIVIFKNSSLLIATICEIETIHISIL